MARRKHTGEVNIGSDSFLDVIANIVGILIILIVIAGVRVSRAPVTKKKAPAAEAMTTPETISIEVAATPSESEPEPDEPLEPEFAEQSEPSADHTAKLSTLQQEIDDLEAAVKVAQSSKQNLEQRQAQGELQLNASRSTLRQEKTQLDTRSRGVEELEALIASQQNSLKSLQAQLAELQAKAPRTKTLKHRVTPISRVVVGEQLHFRLSGNRVSQVPIEDLLHAAMRQVKRHSEELMTTRSHTGTVGPNNGYLLQYRLEAIAPTTSEVARHGTGMIRIALTSFELRPDGDLHDESADEAFIRGSNFDLAQQTADAGATFTLWVYPDSFPLYRKLQTKLHDAGFTVAARPLPHGVPIAGSPEGSASAGQ